jgi:hypothetical protein
MRFTDVFGWLAQSPARDIFVAAVASSLTFVVQRLLQRLNRNEALASEAAKVRLAAYGRVLVALSPVAALVVMAAVTEQTEKDEESFKELVETFDAAHEAAWKVVMAEYLLIGPATSFAMLGFLGYTDNTFDTLKTTPRGDPRRAERLSRVAPMIESVEKALPRFAQLPGEHHFRQHDLATVYTGVGVWVKKGGTYEIVNPGE